MIRHFRSLKKHSDFLNPRLARVFSVLIVFSIWLAPQSHGKERIEEKRAAVKKPVHENRIREDIHRLQGAESDSELALARLKSLPRAKILAVLKDDLTSNAGVPPGVIQGILGLEARELLPDLISVAAKFDNWSVFMAINQLVDPQDRVQADEVSKMYMTRIKSIRSAPTRVAVVDGLTKYGKPISDELFKELILDQSLDVRIAVVEQFLSSRFALTQNQQIERWTAALELKPYQARLLAMEEFARLPKDSLEKLKSAFKPELCNSEPNQKVKDICFEIVKLYKSDSKDDVKSAVKSGGKS